MSLKIVIVGGVAGGASAAAKARRENENAEITIYERGPYVSFANCGLPYYIGGDIKDRDNLLLMTPQKFWDKYRIQVKTLHEVLSIQRDQKLIRVKTPEEQIIETPYDKLILSQGASPIVPPFKGVTQNHVFTLRDVPDMDKIYTFLAKEKIQTAVVVGGGFIGLEMAEALIHRHIKVTVIEKAPHILPLLDDDMAHELNRTLTEEKLSIISGMGVTEIGSDHVVLEDGKKIPAQMVLLSVGVRPEVTLAKEAGLEIGITGGVKANGRMESSDPDIYAVGDAAETRHLITGGRVRIALAGPANRQGRIAGANAAGKHLTYMGAMGTSIVRILNRTVGYVGLNSKQAKDAGFSFFYSITRDPSHASYYPGAQTVITKLLVEEGQGRILGAQVLGADGIDKRIDVLATAIYGGMTIHDLESIDLAYAPPFGSAQDPINIAAFVASNELRGDVKTIEASSLKNEKVFLIDVRDPDELEEFGKIPEAHNIPLIQLRDRLSEIPKDQKVVVYCQKGQRGYLGWKILHQNGFQVYNLKGGFLEFRNS
ncbi:MAG: FAD-dependent oxidoreductase [Deltaproteobacteria bacterium]|nr:MAG: FAD-dependent oxidoreductase [Deltaproteobacteria bacterium]